MYCYLCPYKDYELKKEDKNNILMNGILSCFCPFLNEYLEIYDNKGCARKCVLDIHKKEAK